MTTFVQLHFLSFAPPSCINRDDAGRPKTAMVGGEPRLRLSSQSLKRAWRTSDVFSRKLTGHLSKRTNRFGEEIKNRLMAERQLDEKKALEITRRVIPAFGKPEGEKEKHPERTKQLAFITAQEMQAALDLANRIADGEKIDDKKIASLVLSNAETAADVAMFGRMFALSTAFNCEAAVQVAHAITTHRVDVEDDFYSAVDDLNKGEEEVGAGFIGEAGFGSGLFYLYVCVDVDLLLENLAQDAALAQTAAAALIEAAAKVAPDGKRASFGSHMRASYVLCEKGADQPRSLVAAFAKAAPAQDPLEKSIERLAKLRAGFASAYGEQIDSIEMNATGGGKTLADVIAFACDWKA